MTTDNKFGIVSLSTQEDKCVLAIPDENVGHVKCIHFNGGEKGTSDKEIVQIKCHDSALACIKLSQDGSVIATASTKGTLIRLFDTASAK